MRGVVKKAVSVTKKAVGLGRRAVPALKTASTAVDVANKLLKKVKVKKRKKNTANSLKMKRLVKYKYRYNGGSTKNHVLKASAGFGLSEVANMALGNNLVGAGAGLVGSYFVAGKIGLIGSALHTILKSDLFNLFGQKRSFRNF